MIFYTPRFEDLGKTINLNPTFFSCSVLIVADLYKYSCLANSFLNFRRCLFITWSKLTFKCLVFHDLRSKNLAKVKETEERVTG